MALEYFPNDFPSRLSCIFSGAQPVDTDTLPPTKHKHQNDLLHALRITFSKQRSRRLCEHRRWSCEFSHRTPYIVRKSSTTTLTTPDPFKHPKLIRTHRQAVVEKDHITFEIELRHHEYIANQNPFAIGFVRCARRQMSD